MKIALALWLTVTHISPLLAQSAGGSPTPDITCDKPQTRVEQTVCGDAALQSMGLSVAELYSSTLPLANSPGAEVQRRFRWLQRLNECNKQRGESLKTCVQSSYEERLGELEALATDFRARAEERRATTERAAAAAQAARDFADQEAERRRVELAAQEAAAAQAAQDSARQARESAAVREGARYATGDASTAPRESAQPPPQNSLPATAPESTAMSVAPDESDAPSQSQSGGGDGDGVIILFIVVGIALAPFVYGASGAVSYCHRRGFVVYSARRYLLLWSWGAVGLIGIVAELASQSSFVMGLDENSYVGGFIVPLIITLWWGLQCWRAKALNPNASLTEIAVITLARASSAALFAVLAWGILGNAKRATSSSHSLNEQLAGAVNLFILVTFATLYGNFVCYPRFDKYPQSAYALMTV